MTKNIQFHHGVQPNDPAKPRLKVARFLTEAPTYPQSLDYLTRVDNYPMYLNDRYGDCTFAGAGHMIQAESTYGQGSTQTVTDADVIKGYSELTGFNPADPSTDNGAVMQDVLNYWRKTGIGGHQILAFAEVDHKNMDEVRAALNTFGSLYIGIDFPGSAMDQFNRGEKWDYVPGSTIEGGHAIHGGLYEIGAVDMKIVTWGEIHEMTQAFWDNYVFECWVVITPEWLSAQGLSPTGLDLYGLGQELQELTGEPNPFLPAPNRGLLRLLNLLRQFLATLTKFFKRS
jgi:hypothetical protein